MKYYRVILIDTIGTINFYSVVEDPEDFDGFTEHDTVFGKFVTKFESSEERKDEFEEIFGHIKRMGERRDIEGRFENLVKALPAKKVGGKNVWIDSYGDNFGLRLYYYQHDEENVFLFGGGCKDHTKCIGLP